MSGRWGGQCPECGQLYSAGGHAHVCPVKRKVFVLTADYSYETRNVVGVFATRAGAEAEQVEARKWPVSPDDFTIEEHEVQP